MLLKTGSGVPQNVYQEHHFFLKISQTERKFNSHKALFQLGIMSEYGIGVEQNYSKALEYYQKAADQENILGFIKIGDFYAKGIQFPQDYSMEYYQKATQYPKHSVAFQRIGELYENGYSVEKSEQKAME